MVTPAITEISPLLGTGTTEAPIAPVETVPAASPIPAPTPPPVPVVETPPAQQPAVYSELESLRRRVAVAEAEKQEAETEAILQKEAEAVRQEELAAGQTEADAVRIARRHYAQGRRVMAQEQQLRQQQQFVQEKQEAAVWLSKETGVPVNTLMAASTGFKPIRQAFDEMFAVANREKENIALKARITALEKGQVQPQTVAGNGSRATNITPDAANIDKLWVDHERNNPGAPNPYDAPYRKFLNG